MNNRFSKLMKKFSGDKIDRESVKEYGMTLAKEIYGDKTDESIVDKIVDHAIEESNGEEGTAMGIVKNSYTKFSKNEKFSKLMKRFSEFKSESEFLYTVKSQLEGLQDAGTNGLGDIIGEIENRIKALDNNQ